MDRLENEIVPALRSGFIVLTDRYVYSLMARAIVRGMDSSWIRSIYSVALKPDATFYLRLSISQLVPRIVFSHGFDYWESGMDLYPGQDMYDSFCNYQAALLAEFDRLSKEYNFEVVDASTGAEKVFELLKAGILRILEVDSRKAYISKRYEESFASTPNAGKEELVAGARSITASEFDLMLRSITAHASNGNGRAVHDHK